tara:strand:+ start:182 stop:370 length:189 start_codon:yes stop_codon:yes gene_type:complete
MQKNTIITTSAVVLFLLGIIHLIRIFYGWEMKINQLEIPTWTSFIGTAVPIFLSYKLLKIRN